MTTTEQDEQRQKRVFAEETEDSSLMKFFDSFPSCKMRVSPKKVDSHVAENTDSFSASASASAATGFELHFSPMLKGRESFALLPGPEII